MNGTYRRFETNVSQGEIIERDLEGFLDFLAELVGTRSSWTSTTACRA